MAKICKNTSHQTVITSLNEYVNVYGVPKRIKSDRGGAFISKEYKEFCKSQKTICEYGTANLYTGTGLVERTIQPMKNFFTGKPGRRNKFTRKRKESTIPANKKTPFEIHFGRETGTKLSNLKNAVSVDSKDLSVYITQNSAGEITDHLVMSKKKTVDPKFRRGMTIQQTKKPTGSVSMNKFKNPSKFYEKNYKKGSLDSKLKNKMQTAISGTDHTVTTNKNKITRRKLISNPLPFQQTITAPTKRITTRQNEQPSCSKTLYTTTAGGNPCIYTRKKTPRPINHERSQDWLKRKEQPRNNKGQFTSPNNSLEEKEMDLNLSIV